MEFGLESIAQKLILVVFLISLLSTLGAAQYADGPEWWNDDWSHKKIYEIQADSTIKNYPVKVNIDTQSMIDKGIMESDCSDLRIAWQSNEKLPTEIVSGCDTTSTTVAFLTPGQTFSPGTYNFYVYTGNPNAGFTGDSADVQGAFNEGWESYSQGSSLDSLGNLWEGSASISYREYSGSRGLEIPSRGPSRSKGAYLDLDKHFDFSNGGFKGDFYYEHYWWETSNNGGHSLDAVACDSSTGVIGHGGNNPSYDVKTDGSSYSNSGMSQYYSGGSYQTWHRAETDIDWDNKFADLYTVGYGNSNTGTNANWNGDYEICEFGQWAYEDFHIDELSITFNAVSITERGGLVNVFGRLRDDAGNAVSGVEVTPVETGTTNDLTSNTGEMCLEDGVTGPDGKFECSVDFNREFDLNLPNGQIMSGIDFSDFNEEVWYEVENSADRFVPYVSHNVDDSNRLNISLTNQTGEYVAGNETIIKQAGTDNVTCRMTTPRQGIASCAISPKKVYDMTLRSSVHQNELVFRNLRVPDVVEAGYNQNFIPESTMSKSLKFSAGQVLPAQTMVTRPFSDFDVVNVSVEKELNESYRMVSDVLVRKFNVDFEGSWQDWEDRRTVSVHEIYNRDWNDSGSEMNDAWGVITFNPEGLQNGDCSDIRLTDKNNNEQDFVVNTCQDDYVELEFNAPIDALQEKEFYVYYGNSGATDAQTSVEKPSETRQYDFDTGVTGTSETYFYEDNDGGTKGFNTTIPQNINFIERSMTVEGDRTRPETNNLPVNLDTDIQNFTGVEVEPTRPYVLQDIKIHMANTTADTEFVMRNQSSGENIFVKDIPDEGGGNYSLSFDDQSVFRSGHRFLMFIRHGTPRRASSTETQRPMFELTDNTIHRQLYGLNSEGTSGTEGDYPVLVSQINTTNPVDIPVSLDTDIQDRTGMEVEPIRPYILDDINIQMSSTTASSEFVIRNQSSGNNIIVKNIPDDGAGDYQLNFTDESVFRPDHRFLMFVRNGDPSRASTAETQRPMFSLTDNTFHRQLFSLNSDGSGGTEGDYPVLVTQINTVYPGKPLDLPVSLGTDIQDRTGVEIEPTRRYLLEGVTIQMTNTTVDTEFVIRNQSSGENILVRDIPNGGAGEYNIDYSNESILRTGENEVFSPGHRFLMFVRYGDARRASSTETQRPMFDLTDTTFHRQLLGLNSQGTGGYEADYPVLVSQIDTIDPEYPTNVTITHENTGQQVYNGPDQLKDQQTIDLSSFLDTETWRIGDPLDDPKLHEFSVESDTDGNLSMTFDTRVEFQQPVTTVSKTASGCSVNPESQTYFHIDRSDCSYLNRLNVSQGQWFRLDYRFRTPGPNDFEAPGDTNSYNISDTIVRFDILQETEEFTSG